MGVIDVMVFLVAGAVLLTASAVSVIVVIRAQRRLIAGEKQITEELVTSATRAEVLLDELSALVESNSEVSEAGFSVTNRASIAENPPPVFMQRGSVIEDSPWLHTPSEPSMAYNVQFLRGLESKRDPALICVWLAETPDRRYVRWFYRYAEENWQLQLESKDYAKCRSVDRLGLGLASV